MTERVDVCLCTFRRPGVTETIHSLARQRFPKGTEMRVIVADNDDAPSGEETVCRAAARYGLVLRYVHAPARNISVARNAALDAATAPWIAMLDDDETAEPDWLARLLGRARDTGADVVLGPVQSDYSPEAPDWMRRGRFHETRPVMVRGRILTGYTCNVLFRRDAPAIAGQRFLAGLGRTGGEDTEFFDRLVRRGARIAYAEDALVREAVPRERERLGWLLRRRFRFGQSHGALLAAGAAGAGPRARNLALASAKALYSLGGTALSLPWKTRRAFWLLRAALHAGVASRLLGRPTLELYGRAPDE